MSDDILSILNHVSIGVTDLDKSMKFYDQVLSTIGAKRIHEIPGITIAYGKFFPEFWIGTPYDGKLATTGNGVHIGFLAPAQNAVKEFFRLAVEARGVADGEPGRRPEYGSGYYGCFVRDPDGHKIEATTIPDETN